MAGGFWPSMPHRTSASGGGGSPSAPPLTAAAATAPRGASAARTSAASEITVAASGVPDVDPAAPYGQLLGGALPVLAPPAMARDVPASGVGAAGASASAAPFAYHDQGGGIDAQQQPGPVVSRSQVLAELQMQQLQQQHEQQQQQYHSNKQGRRVTLFVDADASARSTGAGRAPAPPASRASSSSAAGSSVHGGGHQHQNHHQALAQWLVAPPPDEASSRRYWALWTSLFTLFACVLFAFMAGGYGLYLQSSTYRAYQAAAGGSVVAVPLDRMAWGPSAALSWLRFWEQGATSSFDVGYLNAWGARYAPLLRTAQQGGPNEWWRLFSSVALHSSLSHVLSNIVVFVVLAVPLEHVYGPLRVLAVFLAAAFGGTFLSMAFEDQCLVYVGASGAVFGLLGLSLADLLVNWESMHRPLLRLVLMLACLGLTLGIEFAGARYGGPLQQRVSHMSHVGGLVGGLVVAWLFTPNFKDRRWRAAKRLARRIGARLSGGGAHAHHQHAQAFERMRSCWRRHAWAYWLLWAAAAGVALFLFAGLPVYIWQQRLPAAGACPSLTAGA